MLDSSLLMSLAEQRRFGTCRKVQQQQNNLPLISLTVHLIFKHYYWEMNTLQYKEARYYCHQSSKETF